MDNVTYKSDDNCDFITKNDIINIINDSGYKYESVCLNKYSVCKASDKMLGFLADYWKLKIEITTNDNINNTISLFIKAISRTNAAKADMVKDLKLFEKEAFFFTNIKKRITIPGIKPWSANLVTYLNDGVVFEDLNALNYMNSNKFDTFDEKHTLIALETLARFHASSIIYEEKMSKLLGKMYYINADYEKNLDRGGYKISDPWYLQCMMSALAAIKTYSKYRSDNNTLQLIESRWEKIWKTALDLSDASSEFRNVICHRDLWNNNLLFKYKKVGLKMIPEDCLLVDFQAVRYQPPAGDVMLLLYCNLENRFREKNITTFLNYYYNTLAKILEENGVSINSVLTLQEFLNSCKQQRLWGLIVTACLIPQVWIDDDLITAIFCDTAQFENILTKNKTKFINEMIENNGDYKNKVLQIFEEIVERYCLHDDCL